MKKTPELVAEAKRLREEGLSLAKAGTLLGVSADTIHCWTDEKAEERKRLRCIANKEKSAVYRAENKDRTSRNNKEYWLENKDRLAEYQRGRREENAMSSRKWYSNNKESRREYVQGIKESRNKRDRYRRATDPQYRISRNLRNRLWYAINGGYKAGSAVSDLGCSVEDLKLRLEFLFEPGMTCDNYGEWHIDHIRPLAIFDLTDRDQFLQACNFTNLQPMWAEDNLRKGDRCEGLRRY